MTAMFPKNMVARAILNRRADYHPRRLGFKEMYQQGTLRKGSLYSFRKFLARSAKTPPTSRTLSGAAATQIKNQEQEEKRTRINKNKNKN
jgi:hypothetical protein